MDLTPGTRLGNFEILSALGSGGMGEVYRARDSRLRRDVALKILPSFIRNDPDRVARFEREATILASLNHQNIAAIHGVEEAEGLRALVLELVEGPTLAERVARGPVPLEEALTIAEGICDALEVAHNAGIIHRDLKPANVKVRPDGTVKVLDFGLARAIGSDGIDSDAPNSPTITGPATRAGTILGTAAYMSPEQSRGAVVDARTDVWAFGCVLYEMLTGTRAFQGRDVTETMASVIRDEPKWDVLPPDTPDAVRRMLRRCLAKDSKRRLRDIGDARLELREGDDKTTRSVAASAPAASSSRTMRLWLVVVIAATLITGLLVWNRAGSPPQPVERVTITLPVTAPVSVGSNATATSNSRALTLSPDGATLVYVGLAEGATVSRLYVRAFVASEPHVLEGTDGASAPFFSFDGQSVGFFARGKLKRVSLAGGGVETICDAPDDTGGSGGTWGANGTIVFAVREAARAGLYRVQAAGGTPEALTQPDPSEEGGHADPSFIGTGALLFVTRQTRAGVPLTVKALDLATGQQRQVIAGTARPMYAATGHLLYQNGTSVQAMPFDSKTLQARGTPVTVADGVSGLNFDVASNGRFVSLPEPPYGGQLVWVDRKGMAEPLNTDGARFGRPRLSPDGARLVTEVVRDGRTDIGVYRFDSRTLTLLTTDGRSNSPYWHPDARRVVFRSRANLFWESADATTPAEVFLDAADPALRGTSSLAPGLFAPDGTSYTFVVHGSTATGADIWRMEVGSERKIRPVVQRPGNQWGVRLSPDGRWMSYASNESGQFEVYVEPASGGTFKQQVSSDGGGQAVWSLDGKELFYRRGDRMMVAPVTNRTDAPIGASQLLFRGRYVSTDLPHYDVSRDGKRFVMVAPFPDDAQARTINVIDNWFEELKQRAPVSQ